LGDHWCQVEPDQHDHRTGHDRRQDRVQDLRAQQMDQGSTAITPLVGQAGGSLQAAYLEDLEGEGEVEPEVRVGGEGAE
jgi:hypothetical protein